MMEEGIDDLPNDVYELILNKKIKGDYEITTNLRTAQKFKEGDIFVGCSHGGVGYGDVLERDPALVMQDCKNHIISDWVAQNVYHVVYDPVTFSFDEEKTRKRRETVRNERLKNGLQYDKFLKKWSTHQPSQDILKYYGSWPDNFQTEENQKNLI